MRILFVVSQLTGGGAERMLATFANTLADMGEDVHVLCINQAEEDYAVSEKVSKQMLQLKTPVSIPIPKLQGLCNVLTSVRQIRQLSGDVIIPFCVGVRGYTRAWLATVFSKTKFIYAVRNNEPRKCEDRRSKQGKAFVRRFADGIWIQTGAQRALYSKHLQKKMFEVHNILDGHFLDIPRTERERIRHFVSMGRIHPQKNQKMLIQAFAEMAARTGNRDATLTIFGKAESTECELERDLKELICRHRLEDRVFLPGRAADIEEKYREADAFVLSSDFEGCPNALMEAMAAGLPCISTDCPTGPSMLLESGKNGILVPVGDVEAMSRAMEALIAEPQLAHQMGRAAKQRMSEWESPQELAGQLLMHLKEICS